MLRTILVPLDGSAFGEQALPLALTLARRSGAAVELLHVHVPIAEDYSELQLFDVPLETRVRAEEKAYLERTVAELRQRTGLPLAGTTLDGGVCDGIRAHAEARQADLVVMTTHARGAMGRFWLGSVTDRLIRELPMPLLLVHPQSEAPVSLDAERPLHRFLVPLDGSPLAETMVETAGNLAQACGAEMVLLRVIQPLMAVNLPEGGGNLVEMAQHMAIEIDALQQRIRREAQEYLDRLAAGLKEKGIRAVGQVVVEEKVADALLARKDVDLIALATHGRKGLARVFLGGVTNKVLRGSSLPMLIHRPRQVS